jgi:hypothetical protein
MFARRIFLMFIIIAMMATVVTAQSKRGWGNKTVSGAVPSANANTNAANQAADDGPKDKIEGTWRATETFDPQDIFKVLFTFSAGRDDKNGTTLHTDELYFTGGPSCFPSQGVWKRSGDRTFIVTDEGFCFDPLSTPIFAPAGKIRFKSAITLNNQGTAFDGNMHIDGLDTDGNVVFTADAILHGERMRAEGP